MALATKAIAMIDFIFQQVEGLVLEIGISKETTIKDKMNMGIIIIISCNERLIEGKKIT